MRPLEGRGTSEFLMAGLCCSFIVASGDVKSTGKAILDNPWFTETFSSELWMPFVTGAIYLVPFAVAAFLLSRIPKPSLEDVQDRSERGAMTKQQRTAFLKKFATVLVPLAIVYFFLTAYRDYRDSFQADLLAELGEKDSSIFSEIERWVGFVVLAVMAFLMLFRRHILAMRVTIAVMLIGLGLCIGATLLRQGDQLTAKHWMMATGIGGYLCYIPFNCILFERFVALTKSPGNAVFAIMLFDALGYIGSVGLTLTADFLGAESRIAFFDAYTWVLSAVSIACLIFTFMWIGRYRSETSPNTQNSGVAEIA